MYSIYTFVHCTHKKKSELLQIPRSYNKRRERGSNTPYTESIERMWRVYNTLGMLIVTVPPHILFGDAIAYLEMVVKKYTCSIPRD